ncbi:septal ring lytic transglycosylase RlpA family protein [Salmonirosea aquatica]|uniref:Probable endolytic peptidoglycan transglycosylase RlpA n=1 Tax=Salmonirosea aquatica TaxID=2654236 RepID=A0A7C9BB74_9BACT|nr:septal ring lytic transglycosylase RlpA family protein [Cytophagaceae bacterium SJW1-29]
MNIQSFFIYLLVSFAKPSPDLLADLGKTQTGIASYYAAKFDGNKTYFGEIFDNQEMTAAHPSLPYNTLIEVTNLANNKKVTVRINDRGPHSKSRVLDLSRSAAREIGMVATGVAKVIVKVIGRDGLILLASQKKPVPADVPQVAEQSKPVEEEGFLY